jgi:DNA gyrase subunit A
MADFPVQGRGGQGVIAIQTSGRNGRMVGAIQVEPEDEVVLISSVGTLVRTSVAEISEQGRNTQGVRLIRLDTEERLVGLDRIIVLSDDEQD